MKDKIYLPAFLFLISACLFSKGKSTLRNMKLSPAVHNGGVMALVDAKHHKTPLVFTLNGSPAIAKLVEENTHFVYINNMMRWSINHPVKYTLSLSRANDSITRSFGVHDIEHVRGHFSMNDSIFMLKGLVETALPIEQQMTESQWSDYFQEIKKEGYNFVSLSSLRLTDNMLNAADRCGMIVHTNVMLPPPEENTGKKKKKKKSKHVAEIPPILSELWGEHPSLCLATYDTGAPFDTTGTYLQTQVFNPELAKRDGHLADYRQMVDTTDICLADISRLKHPDSLNTVLERVLCTDGVGGILFASREQGNALKPFMIIGSTDRDSWDSSMSMTMNFHVANNTHDCMEGNRLIWQFMDDNGFVFSQGYAGGLRFSPLTAGLAASAFSPMANVLPGSHVTLNVRLDGSDKQRSWRFKIGYPARIRFMNEQIQKRMQQWCKRNPGEDAVAFKKRVNPVTASRQRKLYAYEEVTKMAIGNEKVGTFRLTSYNPSDGTMVLKFEKKDHSFKLRRMPRNMTALLNEGESVELHNIQVVPTNKDELEIVYAEVRDPATGNMLVYDNRDDEMLESLFINDKYVPMELKELAEREDSILREIRQKVVADAKSRNLITDKTQINVSAHVVTDYAEDGGALQNYQIVFEYHVDDSYSYEEDFGLGRYHIEDSHAALSMLRTIVTAFDKEFSRYITPDKTLNIVITGSADAAPIHGTIKYDGCYGYFTNHPYYLGEVENQLTITETDGITSNEQLAFLRAQGVSDFLLKNLTATEKMNVNYFYNIELAKGRGGKYRRIKVNFNFVDIFEK